MAFRDYIANEIATDAADGLLTRREALRRLALLGISAPAAAALLAACGGDEDTGSAPDRPPAETPTTAPTTTTTVRPGDVVTFPGPRGELRGSFAAAESPKGAVVIIHENRGLTPHFVALPGRLAASGYSALAVDLLSEEGGTAAVGDEAKVQSTLSYAPRARLVADARAGIDELGRRAPGQKVAMMGFCFGGGVVWSVLAAPEPRLAAAVPFYGPFPAGAELTGSKAAVFAIYALLDSDRVNGTRDEAEAALTRAGLVHQLKTYEAADHAFFNDTGPRYNRAAAEQAYADVLDWFGKHLV